MLAKIFDRLEPIRVVLVNVLYHTIQEPIWVLAGGGSECIFAIYFLRLLYFNLYLYIISFHLKSYQLFTRFVFHY